MGDLISHGWPAPAKINRFLHIIGRRADGYHLLQTVFQFLDVADLLDFRLRQDGEIVLLTAFEDVAVQDNLVIKAARLLQEYSRTAQGIEITIHKKLPMGGGLGGGSSNAATVLIALNHLWQLDYQMPVLTELGLELGADVPVFVHGQATWAEGVGEKFIDVQLDEPWFCVIVPAVHVSTAGIFADPELTRNSSPIKITDFLAGQARNDCEALVCRRYHQVAEVQEWMQSHADPHPELLVSTRLTGTGACLFAGFKTEQGAKTILKQVPSGWQAFIAKGLNQSPLLHKLNQEVQTNTS